MFSDQALLHRERQGAARVPQRQDHLQDPALQKHLQAGRRPEEENPHQGKGDPGLNVIKLFLPEILKIEISPKFENLGTFLELICVYQL